MSQTQLLQLFLALAASAMSLGETVSIDSLLYALAVVVTVAVGTRLRVTRSPPPVKSEGEA